MKLDIYYHIGDFPHWQEQVDAHIALIKRTGLWDQADRVHFQLHYTPANYTEWLQTSPYIQEDKVSYTQFHQQVVDATHSPSFRPLGECYSIIELQQHCEEALEPRAILRLSNKGSTHRMDETWPVAEAWNRYLEYWNIELWRTNYAAMQDGWDTSGANWHDWGDPTGHWSGTWFWARSDYLKRIPPLTAPHLKLFEKQLGGFSNRHDAEVWIGQGKPKVLELHHYHHALVYHVEPPSNYRLPHDPVL